MSQPLPSTVIGSSSANTPHVAPERHQKRSVSEHFNHVLLFTWFCLCPCSALHCLEVANQSHAPLPPLPLLFSFPPPPISLLYILFIRPLGRTIARDGLLPTLWNKSSVSILADIVAGTHTYTHARTHTQTHTPPGNFTAPCILLGVVLALRSKDSLTDCLMGQRPSLIQDDSLRCLGL